MSDKTLEYYNANAEKFVESTLFVDFSQVQCEFLNLLMPESYILDFGCGSGRDMKYFLEHVPVKAVFPMHCWDHYEICQKVQDEPSMQGLLEHFHPIEYKGQEWTLC